MGSVFDHELRAGVVRDERPRTVGAMPAAPAERVTATAVQQVRGEWAYGEEIPVQATLNAIHEADCGDGETLFWSGMEVKVEAARLRGFAKPWLVTALRPASLLWWAAAEFHKGGDDPFEKDEGWMVARVDDPKRLHWERGEVLGDGFLVDRNPNRDSKKARWYFAVCEDLDRAERELLGSQRGWDLLLAAENGELSEQFRRGSAERDAAMPVAESNSLVVGGSLHAEELRGVYGKKVRGRQDWEVEVRVKKGVFPFPLDFARGVLHGAVRQALAGRDEGSRVGLGGRIRMTYLELMGDYADRDRRRE